MIKIILCLGAFLLTAGAQAGKKAPQERMALQHEFLEKMQMLQKMKEEKESGWKNRQKEEDMLYQEVIIKAMKQALLEKENAERKETYEPNNDEKKE